MQFLHNRSAVLLMKTQPLRRCQAPLTNHSLMAVHLAECFQHTAALVGEASGHVYELPPPMGQTVGHQDLHATSELRHVPRQGIAHLNGWCEFSGPPLQYLGQVLTRML